MPPLPTVDQFSAGGVAFRRTGDGIEVALVLTPPKRRWQLPKGLVDAGETPEQAALREVREEAGLATDLLAPLETVEYWYVGGRAGQRVRFHKRVHFYLLAYRSGDVADHDREVLEARWVPIAEAPGLLAFENERAIVRQAEAQIAELG